MSYLPPELVNELRKFQDVFDLYERSGEARIKHNQTVVLKEAHLKLFNETLNIYCAPCIAKSIKGIGAYLKSVKPLSPSPQITKVIRARNTEPTKTITKEPTWSEVKEMAKEKGIKIFGKNKKQLLEEIGKA